MEKEAKAASEQQTNAIEAKRRDAVARLIELNVERRAGTITQGEYERQVEMLAG